MRIKVFGVGQSRCLDWDNKDVWGVRIEVFGV